MREELYKIESEEDFLVFEFISKGRKGRITKRVQYTKTRIPNLYSLGFGDKTDFTGSIDDKVITNNGDSQKVIATVASTIELFMKQYPQAFIYAAGSNKARTRLYRMLISKNLGLIKSRFEIFGMKGHEHYPFEKDMKYDGFLLCNKKNKFIL